MKAFRAAVVVALLIFLASFSGSVEGAGWQTATASWFGPGLYGQKMANGDVLTPSTWGVAHRTLPFGTPVTFRHSGNVVTASVTDRGPAAWTGRTFDLTGPVKNALGCPDICHLQYAVGGEPGSAAPVASDEEEREALVVPTADAPAPQPLAPVAAATLPASDTGP